MPLTPLATGDSPSSLQFLTVLHSRLLRYFLPTYSPPNTSTESPSIDDPVLLPDMCSEPHCCMHIFTKMSVIIYGPAESICEKFSCKRRRITSNNQTTECRLFGVIRLELLLKVEMISRSPLLKQLQFRSCYEPHNHGQYDLHTDNTPSISKVIFTLE